MSKAGVVKSKGKQFSVDTYQVTLGHAGESGNVPRVDFWVKDAQDSTLGFCVELSRGPAGIAVRVDSFVGTPKIDAVIPGDTVSGMSACQYRLDATSQEFRAKYARENWVGFD